MDNVDKKDIKKEAKFLAKLNHPNIIQIKGICLTESCIMMEFMWLDLQLYRSINVVHSVNDLLLQLSKPSSHGYDFTILKLAQGILNGLSFLLELGVAHRNLKPNNILVNNPKHTPTFYKLTYLILESRGRILRKLLNVWRRIQSMSTRASLIWILNLLGNMWYWDKH